MKHAMMAIRITGMAVQGTVERSNLVTSVLSGATVVVLSVATGIANGRKSVA